MPLAVITIAFDPVLELSDTSSVRVETIALGIVLFLGLALAARMALITPSIGPYVPAPGLRFDDMVFILVGAVPGAIAGGRLGYVLDHLAYYKANPAAILDPAQGGLTLTLAVPLGILTGGFIARLLGAPVGRWLHATAFPLLFVLAAGKLIGVLGATGQGAPSDLPGRRRTPVPVRGGSLAAEIPSHPAQVYEAILVGARHRRPGCGRPHRGHRPTRWRGDVRSHRALGDRPIPRRLHVARPGARSGPCGWSSCSTSG